MSYQIDNQEIGSYISGFIEREFKSARQFCKVYLQTNGIKEPAKEDIQNMANRLSQIKKGGGESNSDLCFANFFRIAPRFR